MKKENVEKTIAKILAQRYWDGTRDKHNVSNMTLKEYTDKSLINWISAARGIVSLVKQIESKK